MGAEDLRERQDTPLLDSPVPPGTVLDGRYVVGDVLAEGGMGIVYAGRHVELGQPVAIKFLRLDVADRPSMVPRFLNEARAAASLRNEHVVRILDVGQLDSGRPYLVMERLAGIDLDQLLEREGRLDAGRAIEYVEQICAALGEAHRSGIVHRDIKLENVFLAEGSSEHPMVKVIDFGLAKRLDRSRSLELTGPQDSMGSPFYMSPEQIVATKGVDARTDIWALGVVLYRLLTGTFPFVGDTVTEVYARALHARPAPMRDIVPTLDPELDRIVARCLEKDATRRYQSVSELASALEASRRPDAHGVVTTSQRRRAAFPVDDSPVVLPGVHSRWPYALLMLLAASGALAYEADRTGRVNLHGQVDRMRDAALQTPAVRRVVDRLDFGPRLGPTADTPFVRAAIPAIPVSPLGVCAAEPAFDSSGRTVRAEPERQRAEPPNEE